MEDDGDYFTWTVAEATAALMPEEFEVAALHYDINEIGEMHHDPAKNVLYIRAGVEEIARRFKLSEQRVRELLASAKKKMYAARLGRPTPYVDKTIYTGWNAMCVSAYLEAARVLALPDALRFALRSLDRLLSDGWSDTATATNSIATTTANAADKGVRPTLKDVIAYADPKAEHREIPGVLVDYAVAVVACLDAYEATSDLSYFRFARSVADAMVDRFFDAVSGGFFDTARIGATACKPALGIMDPTRKPF